MSKETKVERSVVEKNDAQTKPNGKKWGILGAIVVVLLALVAGISIYNAPANRLSRQLNLGNRYLKEQNYEQAIVEFDKAIAIDPMSIDAYLGKAQAYEGLDDIDMAIQTLAYGYEKTEDKQIQEAWLSEQLGLAHKYMEEQNYEQAIWEFDKAIEIDPMNVDAYLSRAQAYEELGDIDMALQILEEGLERTGDERIKDKLIEEYVKRANEYTEKADYEKALSIYDRLLELDGESAQVQSDLGSCLLKYLDLLMEQGRYDEARDLIEKYKDIVSGIDFQTILDEILARENIDLLLEQKRYDEARTLIEEQQNKTDDEDFQEMLDIVLEQIELAESAAWVDDLYEKMISGDRDAVFDIISAPDFLEKCSTFEHEEVVWSTDYTLLTSDGKVVGVIDSLDDDSIIVAHCVHDEEFNWSKCPTAVEEGDYSYEIDRDGNRYWLIKDTFHRWEDGVLSEGEIYNVFHV